MQFWNMVYHQTPKKLWCDVVVSVDNTISGANEHTEIKDLMDLLYKYPRIELGIQMSPTKASYNCKRFEWLEMLHDYAATMRQNINVALHTNPGWVEQICAGYIPLEVLKLITLKNPDGGNMVKRLQLNFLIGREPTPNIDTLHWVISKLYHYRFIFSYNEANKEFIENFYFRYGHCFDLIYDESHGEGKPPQQWKPAVYSDVIQGYSGGLSPDNVHAEVTKIALLNPGNSPTWIDAEGKLKGDDGHLSLEKAEAFIQGIRGYLNPHDETSSQDWKL